MDLNEIFAVLEANGNDERAFGMSAYMRNIFPFLGIAKPVRATLCKPYFAESRKAKSIDWAFVDACWDKPQREFQYVAVDYLKMNRKKVELTDLHRIANLIMTKSWWDTVDSLYSPVSSLAIRYPEMEGHMLAWSTHENMWIRRMSIIHQLLLRSDTNTELLAQIIRNNLGQKEFFINKAIGWALREYSKTDEAWVRAFIDANRSDLSNLSVREALKYVERRVGKK
jgi:3-methyladenine DNA glycosylase AlkD